MTRLIDADALRDKLQEEIDKAIPPFDDVIGSIRCGVRLARNIVEDEPTIDAVPVRHGKWIDEGQYADYHLHHAWRCSECGEHVLEIGVPWFKYCPNCGAKMDEERDSDHAEEEIL